MPAQVVQEGAISRLISAVEQKEASRAHNRMHISLRYLSDGSLGVEHCATGTVDREVNNTQGDCNAATDI